MLESLPETRDRDTRELALQIELGPALMSARGFGDPRVGQAYRTASELAAGIGDSGRQFTALWGLWIYNVTTDRFREARQLSADLIDLSGRQPDQDFVFQARHAAWTTDLMAGDFSSCWDHASKGIDAYDAEAHRGHRFLYGGHDPGVCGRNFGAMAQWILGRPDKAMATSENAVALGERIEHPNSHVQALAFGSWLRQLRREPDAAAGLAEAAVALSTAHGIGMWVPMSTILGGWAVAEGGAPADGIEQMRRGLDAYGAAGAGSWTTIFAAALADAVAKSGAHAEALSLLADAEDILAETRVRWADAEIHRVRGETLLRRSADDHEEAAVELQAALEIARRQKAKSLELRAATSLARLWGEDGRRVEAREVLAPVYGWFTEGFETTDLRDAGALLDELS